MMANNVAKRVFGRNGSAGQMAAWLRVRCAAGQRKAAARRERERKAREAAEAREAA
jgi:hypothetical protein